MQSYLFHIHMYVVCVHVCVHGLVNVGVGLMRVCVYKHAHQVPTNYRPTHVVGWQSYMSTIGHPHPTTEQETVIIHEQIVIVYWSVDYTSVTGSKNGSGMQK